MVFMCPNCGKALVQIALEYQPATMSDAEKNPKKRDRTLLLLEMSKKEVEFILAEFGSQRASTKG
jgi:hypothetical protein